MIQDVLENAWAGQMNGTLGQDDGDDTLKIDGDESIEAMAEGKTNSPILSSIKAMASNLLSGSPAPNSTGAVETVDGGHDVDGRVDGSAEP